MNKKGFTLIELLAVIVILAVIALIVTPIVTGIISSAKLSADMRSAEGYVKAAEDYFADSQINDEKKNNLGTNIIDKVEVGNRNNVSGSLIVDEKGMVSMAITINNKCYKKEENTSEINVDDDIDNCNVSLAVVPPDDCFLTSPDANDANSLTIIGYTCGDTVKSVDLPQNSYDLTFYGLKVDYEDDGQYTNIIIPSKINDKNVVSISCMSPVKEESPIGTKSGIKSIIIPDTITKILPSAFLYNEIESAVISDGVEIIDDYTFAGNKLTSIIIPASIKKIGHLAFLSNKLQNVVILNDNVEIGEAAFNSNLLPPDKAFIYGKFNADNHKIYYSSEKSNIISSYGGAERDNVIIPDGVQELYTGAFLNNDIKNISFPNSLISIGRGAFLNNKLTTVTLPSFLKTIDVLSFPNNQLTSIEIPNSVTTIGEQSFSANDTLNSIVIDNIPGSISGTPWGATNATITYKRKLDN